MYTVRVYSLLGRVLEFVSLGIKDKKERKNPYISRAMCQIWCHGYFIRKTLHNRCMHFFCWEVMKSEYQMMMMSRRMMLVMVLLALTTSTYAKNIRSLQYKNKTSKIGYCFAKRNRHILKFRFSEKHRGYCIRKFLFRETVFLHLKLTPLHV